MVAGNSGPTPGSGAGGSDVEESDGRLMLPQAPRNIVSAEASPQLATARALGNLTMVFPPNKFVAAPVRSQAQNCCRSNDVQQNYAARQFNFLIKHPISASPRA